MTQETTQQITGYTDVTLIQQFKVNCVSQYMSTKLSV